MVASNSARSELAAVLKAHSSALETTTLDRVVSRGGRDDFGRVAVHLASLEPAVIRAGASGMISKHLKTALGLVRQRPTDQDHAKIAGLLYGVLAGLNHRQSRYSSSATSSQTILDLLGDKQDHRAIFRSLQSRFVGQGRGDPIGDIFGQILNRNLLATAYSTTFLDKLKGGKLGAAIPLPLRFINSLLRSPTAAQREIQLEDLALAENAAKTNANSTTGATAAMIHGYLYGFMLGKSLRDKGRNPQQA